MLAAHERQAERERRHRVLADIARRQDSVLRQAQHGEPDDPFTRGLRETYNELEAQKNSTPTAIAQLDMVDDTESDRPTAADLDRLDALPYLATNLNQAPQSLRPWLF